MTARSGAARASTARASTPRTSTSRTAGPRTGTARTTADRAAAQARTATPAAAPGPDLRIVPAAPARRAPAGTALRTPERRAPFVLLVVGMLVGTTLGLLFLNTAIAVDSLRASELRAENAELAQDVQALQQRVVSGGAPAALAAAATAAGMVPAGSAAYLVIAPDGSSTVRGEVSPAPEPEPPAAQEPAQEPAQEQGQQPSPGNERVADPAPAGPPAGG